MVSLVDEMKGLVVEKPYTRAFVTLAKNRPPMTVLHNSNPVMKSNLGSTASMNMSQTSMATGRRHERLSQSPRHVYLNQGSIRNWTSNFPVMTVR